MPKSRKSPSSRTTFDVGPDVFKQVYDSPRALPGKHKWVTSDRDVRSIEQMLGIEQGTIGAPLWVSGDTRNCPKCGREISWFDIVASALSKTHGRDLLVKVILGDKKYVNVETPRAIADLVCYRCKTPITDLRSFKCHNWAYAFGDIAQVIKKAGRAKP